MKVIGGDSELLKALGVLVLDGRDHGEVCLHHLVQGIELLQAVGECSRYILFSATYLQACS